MADVVFYQKQEFFNSNPVCRWARLIINEDDYSTYAEEDDYFSFDFESGQCIGSKKIPVGITVEDYIGMKSEYENYQEKILNLLNEEKYGNIINATWTNRMEFIKQSTGKSRYGIKHH